MGLDTEVDKIKARGASGTSLTDGPEDISEGVEATLSTGTGAASSATLFIETQGAIDLKVEFSPDGSSWYEPLDESPISISNPNTEMSYIEYDATSIRVTGSNSTAVNLALRVTA